MRSRRVLYLAAFVLTAFAPAFAIDSDGDGVDDALDCAPSLRSTWAIPSETARLTWMDKTTLTWRAGGQAHTHNVYRGMVAAGSSFAYSHFCLEAQRIVPDATDDGTPPPGGLFYYLVTGRNRCGDGPLGAGSQGPRPLSQACPVKTTDSDGDGVADNDDVCATIIDPEQEDPDLDGIGSACDSCPGDPDNDADGDGICGNFDSRFVISEVRYDQAAGQQEFVELYAPDDSVDVTGWSVSDRDVVTFRFSTTDPRFGCGEPFVLARGERVLVWQGVGTSVCAGPLRQFFLNHSAFMGRDGDDVVLRDAGGGCRDYVAFENGPEVGAPPSDCSWTGPNPGNGDAANVSVARRDRTPFTDTDDGADWEPAGATTTAGPSSPGFANEPDLVDSDGDGLYDATDNCDTTANSDQVESDGDGLGDACDGCPHDSNNDLDHDGVCADLDACPADAANDLDTDGVCGDVDDCPLLTNPDQADLDGDDVGDACDACPSDQSNDADGDGICGAVDNCPSIANPDQADNDSDGTGDVCEPPPTVVLISEVHYDQAINQQEFIELLAVAGPTDVTGWRISDGDDMTLTLAVSDPRFPCTEPFVLNPGDRLVVWQGSGTSVCAGPDRSIYLARAIFLPRTGDDFVLEDETGRCRDYVAFENGPQVGAIPPTCFWSGTNPSNGDVEGVSLSRFDGSPIVDTNTGADWEASGATMTEGPTTPGQPNQPGAADSDGDGVVDAGDNCRFTANPNQEDVDADGAGDACDVCPAVADPSQADLDHDAIGDACDPCPMDAANDADGDAFCGDVDNCPTVANLAQTDGDADGIGDDCDACPTDPSNDGDGDGVCGAVDNCPTVPNPSQTDADQNGIGDACENAITVSIPIVGQDMRSDGSEIAQQRQQSSSRVGRRSAARYRSLAWFDLSSIPPGSHVLGATVVYHTTSGDPSNIDGNGDTAPSGGPITVEVHQVLKEWNYDEPLTYPWDLGDNEKAVEVGDTTWRYSTFPVQWERAGADGTSDCGPAIAEATVSSDLDARYSFQSSGLHAVIRRWVDGLEPNLGLLLRATSAAEAAGLENRKIFCGKGFPLETSTGLTLVEAEAHRPFVRIEYTLP